ncbi:MAG: hypothetical protein ABIZ72_02760 [Candidatus Limnocylindrales bacterium]
MDPVLDRIDAWQQAGLIDPVTADRLRAAETGRGGPDRAPNAGGPRPATRRGVSAADVFGPGPTVVEMFAYLGGGFLLAAWTAFVSRVAGDDSSAVVIGGGLLVAALVLGGLGLVLRSGDERRRRGARMAFLGATLYAVGAAAGFLGSLRVTGSAEALILAVVAVSVAVGVRFLHAGLLTQVGLLASITSVGATSLAWLRDLVAPVSYGEKGEPIGATPDPLVLILVAAATWLIVAFAIGLLAVLEANGRRDSASAPGAPARRATLTRAWAGLVAVAGLASALSATDLRPDGDFGRVVAPWVMDAILLGLAAILVERAFRRRSGAFLVAAGLGMVIALTDFNFSYLSRSPEIGLLIEGGLLLAVGFGADRLRRRLPGFGAAPATPEPPSESPADPELESGNAAAR